MASAEGDTADDTTQVGVEVQSSISIAVQRHLDIEAAPQATNSFSSNSAKLTVATNSNSGYSIYLSTSDGSSKLKSVDLSNTRTIDPVSSNTTPENFTANTWGYSLNGTFYNPVPSTTGPAIFETSTTSHRDNYDLHFGVSVDESLPVGRYFSNVVISAVANPSTITSIDQASYMQTIDPEICKNTAEGISKKLIDLRDGKAYWVARMKDGNCWMTQNLALDITEKGLSSLDTDIAHDWDQNADYYPPQKTNQYALTGVTNNEVAISGTNSWSYGKILVATPLALTNCANISTLSDIQTRCGDYGLIDVSGDEWKPTFEATEGTFSYPNGETYSGLVAIDQDNKTYDAHYLLGNYYQFNAATAGSGFNINSGDAKHSICPKGWRLPSAGADPGTYSTSGSFAYLLHPYGLAQSGIAGVPSNADYNIGTDPFYVVRAGFINPDRYLYDAGTNGYLLSSTVRSYQSTPSTLTLEGQSLYVTRIGSSSSPINMRYASSVRCVLPTE